MKSNNKRNKTIYSNQKGITLIALVITIVVLLILAGVSINAIFSENGIINKAKDAQNKMDQATQNDLDAIDDLSNWIIKQTEEVPDILERYILGENKNGIDILTIVELDEELSEKYQKEIFKFIGNSIITNAQTEIEFKDIELDDENNIKIKIMYKKNYYIITVDNYTEITKNIKRMEIDEVVPDVLERYILGENKSGKTIYEIIKEGENEENTLFIGNNIIPDAETKIEYKKLENKKDKTNLILKYDNSYYIVTVDTNTSITKKVVKLASSNRIFKGEETANKQIQVTKKTSPSKIYAIVYIKNEKENIITTTTNFFISFPIAIAIVDNSNFVLSNDFIAFDNENIILKEVYEVENAYNCVEENGFIAFYDDRKNAGNKNKWKLCVTPSDEYIVPTIVRGERIDVVIMDGISGTPIFTEPIELSTATDPFCPRKIIVTTPDIDFIINSYIDYTALEELDLSKCGDNIEIPTSFTDSYPNVKIYVSPVVKAKYESNDNIIEKQAET